MNSNTIDDEELARQLQQIYDLYESTKNKVDRSSHNPMGVAHFHNHAFGTNINRTARHWSHNNSRPDRTRAQVVKHDISRLS
jgi:hypothetical protein